MVYSMLGQIDMYGWHALTVRTSSTQSDKHAAAADAWRLFEGFLPKGAK